MMTNWRTRAACSTADPEIFFSAVPADKKKALALCAECKVSSLCLSLAQAEEEKMRQGARARGDNDEPLGAHRMRQLLNGIFGGLTAMDRWRLMFPEEAVEIRRQESAAMRAKYAGMTPEERKKASGKSPEAIERSKLAKRAKRAADKQARIAALTN